MSTTAGGRRGAPALGRAAALWPALVAAGLALVAALLQLRGVDLPAQVYRVGLFRREGLTLWDSQWYGGHWTLNYSVLFPPLAGVLGLRLTQAASAGVAALAFDRLVIGHFGRSARAGSLLFAVGTLAQVAIGQLPFLMGEALALSALWAATRGRWRLGDRARGGDSRRESPGRCVPRARRHVLAGRGVAGPPATPGGARGRGRRPRRPAGPAVPRPGRHAVSRRQVRVAGGGLRRRRRSSYRRGSGSCVSARLSTSRRSSGASWCPRHWAGTSAAWVPARERPCWCASPGRGVACSSSPWPSCWRRCNGRLPSARSRATGRIPRRTRRTFAR